MDLDQAIVVTYANFEQDAEVIHLELAFGRAFCNVVIQLHGAPIAQEIILGRLQELDSRGLLPPLL